MDDEAIRKKYCGVLMFDVAPPSGKTLKPCAPLMLDCKSTFETHNMPNNYNFVYTSFIEPVKVTAPDSADAQRLNKIPHSEIPKASVDKNPSSLPSTHDFVESQTSQSETRAQKAPRPPNAFILYRKAKQPEIIMKHGYQSNTELSQLLGEMWKNEPEEIKYQWKKAADLKKLEHFQKYPGYVYRPKKSTRDQKKRRIKRNNKKESKPDFDMLILNAKNTDADIPPIDVPYDTIPTHTDDIDQEFQTFLQEQWYTHTLDEERNTNDFSHDNYIQHFYQQQQQQFNDSFTTFAPYAPINYHYDQPEQLLYDSLTLDIVPLDVDSIIQANLL